MSRLQEFKAELEPYKNTLVINECNKVVRLVDVIRSEGDNYWVYDGFQGITYESCVGGWIPIKGFIDENKYKELVRVWNLNHIQKAI